MNRELREKEADAVRHQEVGRKRRSLELKRKTLEAQISSLQMELEAEEDRVRETETQAGTREERLRQEKEEMGRIRKADDNAVPCVTINPGVGDSK